MHRRYRVFKERLDWNVGTSVGFEIDAFDALKPNYLLLRGDVGRVDGCVRLFPSTGPTMLRDNLLHASSGHFCAEDGRHLGKQPVYS